MDYQGCLFKVYVQRRSDRANKPIPDRWMGVDKRVGIDILLLLLVGFCNPPSQYSSNRPYTSIFILRAQRSMSIMSTISRNTELRVVAQLYWVSPLFESFTDLDAQFPESSTIPASMLRGSRQDATVGGSFCHAEYCCEEEDS